MRFDWSTIVFSQRYVGYLQDVRIYSLTKEINYIYALRISSFSLISWKIIIFAPTRGKTRGGKIEAPARNIYGFKLQIHIVCYSRRNDPDLKTTGAHSRIGLSLNCHQGRRPQGVIGQFFKFVTRLQITQAGFQID